MDQCELPWGWYWEDGLPAGVMLVTRIDGFQLKPYAEHLDKPPAWSLRGGRGFVVDILIEAPTALDAVRQVEESMPLAKWWEGPFKEWEAKIRWCEAQRTKA